ncbi:prefoldin subunit 1 [Diutina catenulata]
MSVPPEALQKVLMEMDNQLNKTRAELASTQYSLSQLNANLNAISVTRSNLTSVCDSHETVWQGIGKAFVAKDVAVYLDDMTEEEKSFKETKSSLEKKKHYLDTTLTNTLNSMAQIVGPQK